MSEEDDYTWLRALNEELWRKPDERSPMQRALQEVVDSFSGSHPPDPLPPREKLTYDEVDRIEALIEEHRLVTELFGCNMFGGVGMSVYQHEVCIGSGVEELLSITEDHLPGPRPPSWHERLMDAEPPPPREEKKPGSGGVDPYAWKFFRGFTTRPDNVRWLKEYKLQPNQPMHHYEY